MIYALLALLLLFLVYAPRFWIRYVTRKYRKDLPDIPGTGGELALHLIERFELEGVRVEETEPDRDHYDPGKRVVRLGPDNFHGRSLAAVAVAAHEVGHAIQFHRDEPISRLRKRYMPLAIGLQRIGAGLLMAMPLILIIFRVPHAALATGLVAVGTQLLSALTYLVMLPEEWDASFGKALPILIQGEYIEESQIEPVRQLLRAAAFTYVAAALANLVNLGRWLAVLRR